MSLLNRWKRGNKIHQYDRCPQVIDRTYWNSRTQYNKAVPIMSYNFQVFNVFYLFGNCEKTVEHRRSVGRCKPFIADKQLVEPVPQFQRCFNRAQFQRMIIMFPMKASDYMGDFQKNDHQFPIWNGWKMDKLGSHHIFRQNPIQLGLI